MKAMIRDWLKQQFGDDESLICELYSQYRIDMEAGLQALKEIYTMEDDMKLREKTHAMKGMALIVGDQETANVLVALQHACEVKERDTQEGLIEKLDALIAAMSVE